MTNTDRQATLTHELQAGPVGVDNRQSYRELTYFPDSTRRSSPSFQTRSYWQAKSEYSLAGGKRADRSAYRELKAAKKDARTRLKAAHEKLTQVEALADKFPGSRLASTDLEQALKAADTDISKLKIIKAAPLVDILATGYNVYDDVHNHGWSVSNAVVADSVATLVGVSAAAGVIALAPEAAPVVIVAGVGLRWAMKPLKPSPP